ncbi:hypothetical protein [Marinobacter sp.]|uniref:hypothetical protein n=1 Tax=Marinobacter sp. TaxID=50741 RepID=UPI0035651FAC
MSSTESQKTAKWLSIAVFGPAVIVGAYMLYNEISSQNEAEAEAARFTELAETVKQHFDEIPPQPTHIRVTTNENGQTSIEPVEGGSADIISVTTTNHNQCESIAKNLTNGDFNYSTVIVGNKRYQVGDWVSTGPTSACLLAFQQSPDRVTVQIEIR